MLILNFAAPARQAFRNGFQKGLGAPFMLYGTFTTPVPYAPITPVVPTTSPAGLAGDWQRIGNDLRSAITQHEQETTPAK